MGRDSDEIGSLPPAYDLDGLLELMTVETFPEFVEFGPAVGEEVW